MYEHDDVATASASVLKIITTRAEKSAGWATYAQAFLSAEVQADIEAHIAQVPAGGACGDASTGDGAAGAAGAAGSAGAAGEGGGRPPTLKRPAPTDGDRIVDSRAAPSPPTPSPRSSGNVSCPPLELVLAPGDARRMILPKMRRDFREFSALTIEHGSSLSLIAQGTQLLNEEFSEADLEADWRKWERIGARMYFFSVVDGGVESAGGPPRCVLRALLDGDESLIASNSTSASDAQQCGFRIVIDYLHTAPQHQGRGHAARLLELVLATARSLGANVFVLALEDSCPFWLSKVMQCSAVQHSSAQCGAV
jgi:GNAT superfamily N-acetyltransferase